MRCSVHNRHLNQWQKFKAWCFNTLNRIFNKWPGPYIPSLPRYMDSKLTQKLPYMNGTQQNAKLSEKVEQMGSWVHICQGQSSHSQKLLTEQEGCRNWGHTGIPSLLSKDRSSLQQAEVSKNTEGKKQSHHNKRKKSAKGLLLLACFIQLPYLHGIWGKIHSAPVLYGLSD